MEAIRLLDKATEPTTIGETSTPGLWNKCGSAIKITLLVVGLLLGAAAALSFFYASGATSPSILTGCALAAIVGAVITHLVQGRTCITDAPQVANTEPPPIETTDTEGQPPPEKLPTASLLFEANVIRKLDRSETSGIVLKKDNQADWHALDELNAAQKKNTDLFYPCSTENSEKNRYTNIRQFTHNFYQFSTDKLRYINASVMLSGEYILAQGPLADTVQDFWDMVWDSGADTVVMATNLVDSGRIKCDLYWPSSPSSPLELDSITIDLKKSKERQFNGFSSLYTIREFTLTKGDEQRVVHQYHFKDWPDHAVHPSLDLILDAITAIDNRHDNRGPLVVHCSAGVGRSGVFLICHLLNQLHNFYKSQGQAVEIDITALVKLLRTPPYGRHMTIMTKSQFQMLYTFCEHLQAKRAELE